MTVQIVNTLEALDELIKEVENKKAMYKELTPEYMYYRGLLEGLQRAWEVAYNSINSVPEIAGINKGGVHHD